MLANVTQWPGSLEKMQTKCLLTTRAHFEKFQCAKNGYENCFRDFQ